MGPHPFSFSFHLRKRKGIFHDHYPPMPASQLASQPASQLARERERDKERERYRERKEVDVYGEIPLPTPISFRERGREKEGYIPHPTRSSLPSPRQCLTKFQLILFEEAGADGHSPPTTSNTKQHTITTGTPAPISWHWVLASRW